uniref:Uncharacterized protein n=1 Tax=Anguilla anguilla TaxID=7936 RepID=A0A0E9UAV5_ANGAN
MFVYVGHIKQLSLWLYKSTS